MPLLVLSALLATAAPASADSGSRPDAAPATDDDDLALFFADDDLVAASFAPRPIPRAPATVTVITAQDLAAWGDRSVADALARVTGLSVIDDGVLPDAGVRGVHVGAGAPARILKVMLDGRPVSDRVSDAAFLGPELIPIELVERIEVVRGPMSALYGANAFLGAVNVVTRSGGARTDGRARVTAWKGRGAYEGASVGAAGGFVEGPMELVLGFSAAHDRRDGRAAAQSSPSFPALIAEDRLSSRDDDAGHFTAFAKATLGGGAGPDAGSSLSLDASVRGIDRADPFDDRHPLTASGTSRVAWSSGEARLTGATELSDDVGAAAWIGWSGGRPGRGDRLENGAAETYLVRRVGHDGVQGGASLRQRLTERSIIGRGAFSLVVDGAWDRIEAPTWRVVRRSSGGDGRAGDGDDLQPERHVDLSNAGAAMELALTPRRWLDLTLGGRVDRHSVYGAQPTWRGALVADVGGGLTLKALVGTSFLAPSPELLFGRTSGPGDVVGNDSLQPQKAAQAELAAGWRPLAGVVLHLSGYAARVDDLVILQRRGLNLFANNGPSLDTLGTEAELSVRRGPLVVRMGVSRVRATRAADSSDPEPLLAKSRPAQQFPRWSGGFGASLYLAALRLPLAVHADGRWAGARPSTEANALLAEAPYDLSGYVVVDLAVTTEGWRPFGGREVVVRADLQDAFDETPAYPGAGGVDLPSLGRRLAITVEQRF